MTRVKVLLAIASVAMAVGLWSALTAPADTLQGDFTRIINIHAPSMWLAFLAFGLTALGSAMFAAVAAGPDAGGHASIQDAARAMAGLRRRGVPSQRGLSDRLRRSVRGVRPPSRSLRTGNAPCTTCRRSASGSRPRSPRT